MKTAIGSDHAGFELKEVIKKYLNEKGIEVIDFGAFTAESVDYPDFAFETSNSVSSGAADFGILICGSGTGMAITANKVKGIRAANCLTAEMATLARNHNNANVLALGSRLIDNKTAIEIVDAFLSTEFEGGRHQLRVNKIHSNTGA